MIRLYRWNQTVFCKAKSSAMSPYTRPLAIQASIDQPFSVVWFWTGICLSELITCPSASQLMVCLNPAAVCDGHFDCPDYWDEHVNQCENNIQGKWCPLRARSLEGALYTSISLSRDATITSFDSRVVLLMHTQFTILTTTRPPFTESLGVKCHIKVQMKEHNVSNETPW